MLNFCQSGIDFAETELWVPWAAFLVRSPELYIEELLQVASLDHLGHVCCDVLVQTPPAADVPARWDLVRGVVHVEVTPGDAVSVVITRHCDGGSLR